MDPSRTLSGIRGLVAVLFPWGEGVVRDEVDQGGTSVEGWVMLNLNGWGWGGDGDTRNTCAASIMRWGGVGLRKVRRRQKVSLGWTFRVRHAETAPSTRWRQKSPPNRDPRSTHRRDGGGRSRSSHRLAQCRLAHRTRAGRSWRPHRGNCLIVPARARRLHGVPRFPGHGFVGCV